MNLIADTANFIVLVPQALSDPIAGTAWNSGAGISGYYPNKNINDVGFINALIDTTIAKYSINQNRVYVCGFSMGGFMTERMAATSNKKITAFASVAGTFGGGLSNLNPGRPIPIVHFHGTSDQTVGYYNNSYGNNVDSLLHFWIANNKCDTTAVHTNLPDIANDGYTVEHFVYPNGLSDVEHFRVNGADHVWLSKPQNDISYTEEIWRFFNKHKSLNAIETLGTDVQQNINIYPNPANDKVFIDLPSSTYNTYAQVTLLNIAGQTLQTQTLQATTTPLDITNLPAGFYFLQIKTAQGMIVKKLVKE
jgi:polyhydroxybutyrate depolymerase